ncbi:MAG: hypothetical protein AB1767_06945 [Bacillota bacterium]
MTEKTNSEVKEEIKLAKFLESAPPNQRKIISDLSIWESSDRRNVMNTPEIRLYCDDDSCNGFRFFRCVSGQDQDLFKSGYEFIYLTYRCSNCQRNLKLFSIAAIILKDTEPKGEVLKLGELPPFGPPVPPRLVKLIGPDKEVFLKGRRCEFQGLGIGAFAYYRRVVENQKNRIIGEIIRVSEKIMAAREKLDVLQQALKETQFSKALDLAKDSLPESLLIDGHSPLFLLHRALSDGIHNRTDEECLELAESVRLVLGELSERLSQALKEDAELSKALSTLMCKKK